MKRNRLIPVVLNLAVIVWGMIVFSGALWALEVPALKGRVNDYGGMLSASVERQLDATLAQLEQTDSTQIVVLTVPSLDGDSLEDFSIRVVDQWAIGQKEVDNGALLLIAKRERKIRIDVGYGLEGKLTDLIAGRIIRDVMVPRFKAGRIDEGVTAGVQTMISAVKGEYKAAAKPRSRSRQGSGGSVNLGALVVFLFLINFLGRLRRGLGAVAGAFILPIIGLLFFNLSFFWILALIPMGLGGGLLLSLFGGPLSFSHAHGSSGRGGGMWLGGGGFGGGGFGGGGFSGGGGGFGGGGASGGW